MVIESASFTSDEILRLKIAGDIIANTANRLGKQDDKVMWDFCSVALDWADSLIAVAKDRL